MISFINKLTEQIDSGLPGEDAQFKMAAMARPRIKEAMVNAVNPRQSAVLVYFFPKNSEWHITLMKRPDYDGTHAGQVSFPGGKLEGNETHQQAAIREFEEETGVSVNHESIIGQLSQLYIPPSNYFVQPYVAYSLEAPTYNPDPEEVAAIIEMRVVDLLEDRLASSGMITLSSGLRMNTPYFEYNNHVIWGATAMMLSELKELLRAINA